MLVAEDELLKQIAFTDSVSKLSPQQQNVIRLLIQGYNTTEIAKMLQVTRPTVSKWRNRAINTLRRELGSSQ